MKKKEERGERFCCKKVGRGIRKENRKEEERRGQEQNTREEARVQAMKDFHIQRFQLQEVGKEFQASFSNG